MPVFYKRFVDDTLSTIRPGSGSSLRISRDIEQESSLHRFYNESRKKWQASLSRNGSYQEWLPPLDTAVYRKPTDKGLLRHFRSHTLTPDTKGSLLNTMLNRAFQLSSTWRFCYHEECERLKDIFSRLRYPDDLAQSTIRRFIESKVSKDSHTPGHISSG